MTATGAVTVFQPVQGARAGDLYQAQDVKDRYGVRPEALPLLLALAGDAAHVNNPLGGMGMNSGIHDGLNLAKKLEEAWHGGDHAALLARYDRQRRPMAEKYVQAQSIANKRLLEENDKEARETRLKELEFAATDENAKRDYLMRASLVQMVEEANAII